MNPLKANISRNTSRRSFTIPDSDMPSSEAAITRRILSVPDFAWAVTPSAIEKRRTKKARERG